MKRGAPDHWKMKELARLCRVPSQYGLPWANGVMERIWHYTAKYCIQGNIGKVPNEEIAEICCWPTKRADQLISGLLQSGWLDFSEKHRLLVHDWKDHCDEAVKKTLKNRGLEVLFPESSRHVPADSSSQLAMAMALKTSKIPLVVAGNGNGKTSERFPEWYAPYPVKDDEDFACRMWVSRVTVADEPAAFACRDRYLRSDRVKRGAVLGAAKFIDQQARNHWNGQWPEAEIDGEDPTVWKGTVFK